MTMTENQIVKARASVWHRLSLLMSLLLSCSSCRK